MKVCDPHPDGRKRACNADTGRCKLTPGKVAKPKPPTKAALKKAEFNALVNALVNSSQTLYPMSRERAIAYVKQMRGGK